VISLIDTDKNGKINYTEFMGEEINYNHFLLIRLQLENFKTLIFNWLKLMSNLY